MSFLPWSLFPSAMVFSICCLMEVLLQLRGRGGTDVSENTDHPLPGAWEPFVFNRTARIAIIPRCCSEDWLQENHLGRIFNTPGTGGSGSEGQCLRESVFLRCHPHKQILFHVTQPSSFEKICEVFSN